MFELAVRTAVILAFAWVVARLLGRATAATRHLVWHLALIAVLAAPLLAPLAPRFRVPGVPGVPNVPSVLQVPRGLPLPDASNVAAVPEGKARTDTHDTGPVISGTSTTLSTLGAVSTSGAVGPLGNTGTFVWATGSGALSVWFLLGWIAAAVMARRADPAPLQWQLEVNALAERLRIAGDVRLRILRGNTSPLAVGLWRSTVLLPASAVTWDSDRRRTVLLHELAHIRRRDCRVQALAQAACAAYWFNPLAWLAFARLRAERERACDDEVLRTGAQPSAYAALLLDIARQLRPTLRPSAALAMARPSELEGRLLAVLAADRVRVPARGTSPVVAVILGLVTIVALGATPVNSSSSPSATKSASGESRAVYVPTAEAPTPTDRLAARRVLSRASQTLASSSDPQVRERAVMDLAASGHVAAIHPLQGALDDSNQDVREKAAMSLGLMSSPDVIPALIKALNDPDSQVREKAALGLALRRDPRSVDALLGAMTDPDSQVREKVAIALGTSGDARAAAALEHALQDPDSQVREKAVAGLVLLHDGNPDAQSVNRLRDGVRSMVGALIRLSK